MTEKPWIEKDSHEERLPHNHIFQSHDVLGNPDCPACQTINPYHMKYEYAYSEHMKLLRGDASWRW